MDDYQEELLSQRHNQEGHHDWLDDDDYEDDAEEM